MKYVLFYPHFTLVLPLRAKKPICTVHNALCHLCDLISQRTAYLLSLCDFSPSTDGQLPRYPNDTGHRISMDNHLHCPSHDPSSSRRSGYVRSCGIRSPLACRRQAPHMLRATSDLFMFVYLHTDGPSIPTSLIPDDSTLSLLISFLTDTFPRSTSLNIPRAVSAIGTGFK
jgi:hypothetical protein